MKTVRPGGRAGTGAAVGGAGAGFGERGAAAAVGVTRRANTAMALASVKAPAAKRDSLFRKCSRTDASTCALRASEVESRSTSGTYPSGKAAEYQVPRGSVVGEPKK